MAWSSLIILLPQNTTQCISNSKQEQGQSVLKKKTLPFSQCLIPEISSLELYQCGQNSTPISVLLTLHLSMSQPVWKGLHLHLDHVRQNRLTCSLGPTAMQDVFGIRLQTRRTHFPDQCRTQTEIPFGMQHWSRHHKKVTCVSLGHTVSQAQ